MSTSAVPKKDEDQFFKSLSTLRSLLKPSQSKTTTRASLSSPARRRSLTAAVAAAPEITSPDHHNLQAKLDQALETVSRERSLRQSLETAFDDLTQHRKAVSNELKQSETAKQQLQEQLTTLQQALQESQDQVAAVQSESETAQQTLRQESQAHLHRADDMEAKMLAAQRQRDELQAKLQSDQAAAQQEKEGYKQSLQSAENVRASLQQALQESTKKEQQLLRQVSLYTSTLPWRATLCVMSKTVKVTSQNVLSPQQLEELQTKAAYKEEDEESESGDEPHSLQRQINQANHRAGLCEEVVRTLKEQLTRCEEHVSKKDDDGVDYQAMHVKSKALLQQKGKLIELLKKKVQSLQENREPKNDRGNEDYKEKYLATSAKLEQSKQRVATLQDKIVHLEADLADDTEEVIADETEEESVDETEEHEDMDQSDRKRDREEDDDQEEEEVIEILEVDDNDDEEDAGVEPESKKVKGGETDSSDD